MDTDQLKSIEIGLRGKLRAAQISEAFIDRNLEDLLQQALTEYANARERGVKIVNPGGWIVHAAHLRAIDLLRHEQHETGGNAEDIATETADETTPLPDEEALGHIQAEQLHRAISRLSTAQRQALSLYYFEDKTTRDGAQALGWSEPTFRRRRDAAIKNLRERLGVSVPEFDIGLAAWLSLTTTGSRLDTITNTVAGPLESARSGAVALIDRTRDLAARILSSGSGETAVGVASPAGKTAAGVCAAAIAACTATGVIGPGVAGIDLIRQNNGPKPAVERRASGEPVTPARLSNAEPTPPGDRSTEKRAKTTPSQQNDAAKRTRQSADETRTKQANSQATSQFGVESQAQTAAPATSTPTTTQSAPAPASAPTPDQSAQQQFGLP